jgi:hypothetical protein
MKWKQSVLASHWYLFTRILDTTFYKTINMKTYHHKSLKSDTVYLDLLFFITDVQNFLL